MVSKCLLSEKSREEIIKSSEILSNFTITNK